MSLVLFGFAVRFFFYSIITNPVWVLLIETLNGMMYALGRAVMVSYSRMISPPSTNHTVLGLVGLFDCIGKYTSYSFFIFFYFISILNLLLLVK